MFAFFFLPVALFSHLLRLTYAQRMVDFPIPPINQNVSSACLAALQRTVSCPGFRAQRAIDNPRLFSHELNELCTEVCRQSLLDTRTAIQQKCTAISERTEFEGVGYPATFVVDHLLYTYSLSCRKSTTGAWCHDVLGRWDNDSSSATCDSVHVVAPGENCNSIAMINSVSTYELLLANPLRLKCEEDPAVLTRLCVPSPCFTHTVQRSDTCARIAEAYDVTEAQLLAWNPNINDDCGNLHTTIGAEIRVSPPSDTIDDTQTRFEPKALLPRAFGTIQGCVKYENYRTLEPGARENITKAMIFINACDFVANWFGTTTDKLLSWNPSLSEDDCRLQAGFSYCVLKSEADHITHRDRMREQECSLGRYTAVPGTASNCTCYAGVMGVDRRDGTDGACENFAEMYRITVPDLIRFNSWLAPDCDNNFYAGMADDDVRMICIEVDGEVGLASSQLSLADPTSMAAMGAASDGVSDAVDTSSPTRMVESWSDGTTAAAGSSSATVESFKTWL